ncbi:hypothetical protein SAMN06295905_0320 [Devosia lucknowensis]|uniref:CAF17 C-terminal domain-containing protein n=1 Tax=Devosia lucknowensis TaxID=1096929 RepID=A0A1Y6EHG8_9HYPH|nr:folate-binding protein YgfZ [Devosia lucknowensis]SMQ60042.1 hypothetical protein SAMN06295905_0320 [Devosia lucknowensis]
MSISLRADRSIFRFAGAEAHRLLNDVLTGVMPGSADGLAHWWALLSPQGKILAEGSASWSEDAIWVDTHHTVADDFFKRMRMYKLRADVEISDMREHYRMGYSPSEVKGATLDRRGPVELGWRVIASVDDAADWSADDTPFHAARIAAGVAVQGNDFPANDAFAHDIGMDMLEGIDFAKGCYVGQEVVSRMKHRGTARRRPVIVTGPAGEASQPVVADGRDVGTIGQVVEGMAVASLRLDRITDPAAATLDGKPVTLTLPAWASYHFGDASDDA